MPTIFKPQKKVRTVAPYKKKNESAKLYGTVQWMHLRDYYIKRNPFCKCCMDSQKVTEATEVHHIVKILSAPEEYRYEVLTDEENLMSVCRICHMKIHRDKNTPYIKTFDEWYLKNIVGIYDDNNKTD